MMDRYSADDACRGDRVTCVSVLGCAGESGVVLGIAESPNYYVRVLLEDRLSVVTTHPANLVLDEAESAIGIALATLYEDNVGLIEVARAGTRLRYSDRVEHGLAHSDTESDWGDTEKCDLCALRATLDSLTDRIKEML